MISKEKAMKIAGAQMPEKGFIVEYAVLKDNVWYIALKKKKMKFQVDIDAKTGKVIGGAGGA